MSWKLSDMTSALCRYGAATAKPGDRGLGELVVAAGGGKKAEAKLRGVSEHGVA
jgi:hypothetical protein